MTMSAREMLGDEIEKLEPDHEGREQAAQELLNQLKDIADELGWRTEWKGKSLQVACGRYHEAIHTYVQTEDDGGIFVFRNAEVRGKPDLQYKRHLKAFVGTKLKVGADGLEEWEPVIDVLARSVIEVARGPKR